MVRAGQVSRWVLSLVAVLCCGPLAATQDPTTTTARRVETVGHARHSLPVGLAPLDTSSAAEEESSGNLRAVAAADTCATGYAAVGKLCGEHTLDTTLPG
jgi:hypothetical protein